MELSMYAEKEKMNSLLSVLRELAKNDSKLAQVLKQFNLL